MGLYREIEVIKIFDSKAIAAGTTATSEVVDLGDYAQGGEFSLHYYIQNGGRVYIYYKLGNDRGNLVYPTGGYSVLNAGTSIGGTSANGRDLVTFTPDFARYMQLLAFESDGITSTTLTAYLAIQ